MEALGINIINIFIYIALFLLLYKILDKFLLSKLDSILTEREGIVEKNLNLANEAEEKMAKAETKIEKDQQEIKELRTEVLKESKEQAQKEAEKIVDSAKAEAKEIVESAQKQTKIESAKQKQEFDKAVETRAKEVVSKLFKDNPDLDSKLLDKLISENL